jgi:hypothetical protein
MSISLFFSWKSSSEQLYYISQFEWNPFQNPHPTRLAGTNPVSIDLNEYKQSWDYGDTDAQKEHNFNQMDTNKDGALMEVDMFVVFATADTNLGKLWWWCWSTPVWWSVQ